MLAFDRSVDVGKREGGMTGKSGTSNGEALTENHQRRLRIHCAHIDKLLSDTEKILHSSEGLSVFPRYLPDLTSAQTRTIESYIQQLRSRLIHVLAWQGMTPETPTIPASRAVGVNLAFVEIAIEELKPKYMRGSGAIPEGALVGLNGVVQELNSVALRLSRYVAVELNENLQSRLSKVSTAAPQFDHLALLEGIISRHDLVQYRAAFKRLVGDAEEATYQIAFFGRVSSGKSSLLNALLEADVLPVGVNPVTAIPTRVEYGDTPELYVVLSGGSSLSIELTEITEFSTEEGNPSNEKGVARLTVRLPLPQLKKGIVLVDTPGIGSVAKSGSREAMSYLPSADLAIVLLNASSTITDEDLDLLRLLSESGIPAVALLSKADLLNKQEQEAALNYVRKELLAQVTASIPVYAMSSESGWAPQRNAFYEIELLPRIRRADELRDVSLAGKVCQFSRLVLSSLSGERRGLAEPSLLGSDQMDFAAPLRSAAGQLTEFASSYRTRMDAVPGRTSSVLRVLATQLAAQAHHTKVEVLPSEVLNQCLQSFVNSLVHAMLRELTSLGQTVYAGLLEAALSSPAADPPSRAVFDTLLRGLPPFDPGIRFEPIHLGWIKVRLPDSLLAHVIERDLQRSYTSAIQASVITYRRVVTEWMGERLTELEDLFNSYADVVRQVGNPSLLETSGSLDTSLDTDIQALQSIIDEPTGYVAHHHDD